MKNLLSMLALGVLLYACRKADKPATLPETPTGERYEVRYDLSGFLHEKANLYNNAKATDSLLSPVSRLWLLTFDATGLPVSVKPYLYDLDSSHFGELRDSLLPGLYYAILVGSEEFLRMNGNIYEWQEAGTYNRNLPKLPLKDTWFGLDEFNNTFHVPEIFMTKIFFAVAKKDTTLPVITLNRIISKIAINVEDALPSQRVEAYINGDANRFWLYNQVSQDFNIGLYGLHKFTRTGTTTLERPVLNTTQGFTVTIVAYDSNNVLLKRKIIPSVYCYQNKRTILKGKLFSPAQFPEAGFSLLVDNKWRDTINIPF